MNSRLARSRSNGVSPRRAVVKRNDENPTFAEDCIKNEGPRCKKSRTNRLDPRNEKLCIRSGNPKKDISSTNKSKSEQIGPTGESGKFNHVRHCSDITNPKRKKSEINGKKPSFERL